MRAEAARARAGTSGAAADDAAPAVTRGLRNPLDPATEVRAVLFDLDGTLYRQTPLRVLMAVELATLPLYGVGRAPRRWGALSAYRRAQERLREQGVAGSIGAAQIEQASRHAGLSVDEVRRLVDEWMHRRPLKYLRLLRASGLLDLLEALDRAGVPAGVLSDYPARQKLDALGLTSRFSVVLAASDPEIGAFKPHPRGFLRACERWRLPPRQVLMVGDRADVDAAGAAAAGLPCVIIGRGRLSSSGRYLRMSSFERLARALGAR